MRISVAYYSLNNGKRVFKRLWNALLVLQNKLKPILIDAKLSVFWIKTEKIPR